MGNLKWLKLFNYTYENEKEKFICARTRQTDQTKRIILPRQSTICLAQFKNIVKSKRIFLTKIQSNVSIIHFDTIISSFYHHQHHSELHFVFSIRKTHLNEFGFFFFFFLSQPFQKAVQTAIRLTVFSSICLAQTMSTRFPSNTRLNCR